MRPSLQQLLAALCLILTACGEGPGDESTAPAAPPPSTEQLELPAKLIASGYEKKRSGENDAALALFEQAGRLLEQHAPGSERLASCLDDQATVHLRLGRSKRARELYRRALALLEGAEGTGDRLAAGITYRIAIADALEQRGVTCSEPGSPAPPGDAGSSLPYFPDVPGMQQALGKLGPRIETCPADPRPITVQAVITGDGKIVHANVKGPSGLAERDRCIVERLLEPHPDLELPGFGACFRPFTVVYRSKGAR